MTVHSVGDPYDPDDAPRPVDRFTWERYIRRSGLPPLTKLVALTMGSYANGKGRSVHPGDDNLSADCGITKRSIITHRLALETAGFLIKTSDARRGRAAEYTLAWPPDFNRLPGSRGPDGGPPIDL